MSKKVSIKELRQNLAKIADAVEKGESYEVIRRSKLSFKVVPITTETDAEWETIIDFTYDGKKKGVKIEDALKALKDLNK